MGGSAEVAGDQRSSPGYCYDADNTSLCATLSDELFGGQLTCSELAALVGAFADALITVRCGVRYLRLNPHGYTRVEGVTIAVQHRFYEMPQRRVIFRDSNGILIMINEKFVVDKAKAPPHTGAQVLVRSVNQLLRYNTSVEARYRIRKMQTHAFSWSDAYKGAYTWARLGYNARLEEISPGLKDTLLKAAQSPDYSNDLRQAMAEVETLNDLILVDGAELWRKYNQEFWGKFYLSPDSDSVAILLRYIKTKGVVI